MMKDQKVNDTKKRDRQALLKAKYCPRVAAASYTLKTHVTLTVDRWPWDLIGL